MRSHAAILIIFLLVANNCNQDQAAEEDTPISSSIIDVRKLPYKFKTIRKSEGPASEYREFRALDLDNDGYSELLTIQRMPVVRHSPQPYFTISDMTNKRVFGVENFDGPITPSFLDIDNNNTLEIIITEQKADSNHIHIYD